jgi:hypothetical protein
MGISRSRLADNHFGVYYPVEVLRRCSGILIGDKLKQQPGAFLIGVMRSGLILAGAPAYRYQAFIGVVLVISVIMNTRIRKAVVGE